MSEYLRIQLYGPLRLTAPDGSDLTPRSAKAQGALALLATGTDQSRSRGWLKDRLWSDRSHEQGAASLRQVLTELRKCLGPHADRLQTTRKSVALDSTGVQVMPAPKEGRAEFLEGIDIRDPAFSDWLHGQRADAAAPDAAHGSPRAVPATPPVIRRLLMVNDAPREGMERFFAENFADSVAQSLTEQTSLEVLRGEAPSGGVDLVLRTQASVDRQVAGLRVSMEQGTQGLNLWSGAELVEMKGAPPVDHRNVLRLIHEATEHVSEALYLAARRTGAAFDASVSARIAVRNLFSMRKPDQLEADKLLITAFELDPRGVYLAWRVFLRIVMLVERHSGLPDNYAEEAEALMARALEMEPYNSMVLAAASQAALILKGENTAGLEYAQRGLKANRANPFAWDSLSVAALYHGNAKIAYRAQQIARHIAGNTPFLHWFDMGCAMTATTQGELSDALMWARKSAATAPYFHPPLRYLIALYAHSGQMESALQIVHKLKRLEPDFSVDRLIDDETYPVMDLRRSQLLSPSLIAALT